MLILKTPKINFSDFFLISKMANLNGNLIRKTYSFWKTNICVARSYILAGTLGGLNSIRKWPFQGPENPFGRFLRAEDTGKKTLQMSLFFCKIVVREAATWFMLKVSICQAFGLLPTRKSKEEEKSHNEDTYLWRKSRPTILLTIIFAIPRLVLFFARRDKINYSEIQKCFFLKSA